MQTTENYTTRTTRLSILPADDPLCSAETGTHVAIEDEATGEYLTITQPCGRAGKDAQTIIVTPDEWPAIQAAIQSLIRGIRKIEGGGESEGETPHASADAERESVCRVADVRGEFVTDADGFDYWWPSGKLECPGRLSPRHLRFLADELDRRNAPRQAAVDLPHLPDAHG